VPDLTNEELTIAVAVLAGIALFSLIVALVALTRLRKARREYMVLRGESGDRDILGAVARAVRKQDEAGKRIDALSASQREQASIGRFALQRFGLVRYDAFEDMGGRLSFSAALLDDHGDGIVITSINGRTETRTYAKSVRGLRSQHNLSEEERAAIEQAAGSKTEGSRASAASVQ
jgi:hypothetical protein